MTQASFRLIIQTLNAANVRYLVVGGIAVNAHGYVRLTVDVDLLMHLDEANIVTALRALENLGYMPTIPVTAEEFAKAENRAAWMAQKQMKVLKLHSDQHRETSIDVFVYDPIGFEDAYGRAEYEPLAEGLKVPVCGYADLVRLKQLAGRPKDIIDLEQLRKARGEK